MSLYVCGQAVSFLKLYSFTHFWCNKTGLTVLILLEGSLWKHTQYNCSGKRVSMFRMIQNVLHQPSNYAKVCVSWVYGEILGRGDLTAHESSIQIKQTLYSCKSDTHEHKCRHFQKSLDSTGTSYGTSSSLLSDTQSGSLPFTQTGSEIVQ